MNWFVFFPRSASSFSIDKIPDRYFPNSYLQCNDANVLSFLYQHFSFPSKILHRFFVQVNCIILDSEKKVLLVCFCWFFCTLFKYVHNDVVKHQSTRNKTHWGLFSHMLSCLIGKFNMWYTVSIVLKMLRNNYQS